MNTKNNFKINAIIANQNLVICCDENLKLKRNKILSL